LPKCERCGRLQIKANVLYGKHICDCVRYNEDLEEKELPVLPHERRMDAFYERQINGLQEKERQLEEEVDTHLEALEIAEDWHKRQKQELLDEITRLKTEVEKLKKQTPQELLDKISKLKEKVKQLEEQNGKLTAQIEIPPKDNKIKQFFKFGGKK
jgi:predicted RNase H-like nuclease (RuvC/YqgF family)